jgi:hypothetical protein
MRKVVYVNHNPIQFHFRLENAMQALHGDLSGLHMSWRSHLGQRICTVAYLHHGQIEQPSTDAQYEEQHLSAREDYRRRQGWEETRQGVGSRV